MGTLNLDPIKNPIAGMVIEYVYHDHKGTLTITNIVTEATDLVRVYYIDEMQGEKAEQGSMYIDSAWDIFLGQIIRIKDVYMINRNPNWEL